MFIQNRITKLHNLPIIAGLNDYLGVMHKLNKVDYKTWQKQPFNYNNWSSRTNYHITLETCNLDENSARF